jgi:hypothetical protein
MVKTERPSLGKTFDSWLPDEGAEISQTTSSLALSSIQYTVLMENVISQKI